MRAASVSRQDNSARFACHRHSGVGIRLKVTETGIAGRDCPESHQAEHTFPVAAADVSVARTCGRSGENCLAVSKNRAEDVLV